MKIAFTGKRPQALCGYQQSLYVDFVANLTATLNLFYERGYDTFISGGAQGFDQLAFWAVHNLKKQHPDVKNIVYVPNKTQADKWLTDGLFGQKEYKLMLSLADEVRIVNPKTGLNKRESIASLFERNHAMVDDADCVIALYPDDTWESSTGGTAETMRYAVEHSKPLYQIFYETGQQGLILTDCKKIR